MALVNRRGQPVDFVPDRRAIDRLLELKRDRGQLFPKIGIFVVSYQASETISHTIHRIPQELNEILEEVFIFDDASKDETFAIASRLRNESLFGNKINVYQNIRNLGYGGNQKLGYRYAIEKSLDYVVLLHGDGQYAPEALPEIILATIENSRPVVFGSRMMERRNALRGGMPMYKWLGNQILTSLENFALGLNLSEFHSGYRCYSTKILSQIPFAANSDDFHFDTQIIIQLRALDVPIYEIPIKTFYGSEVCRVNGWKYAIDVLKSVIDYRLHQLHIVRRLEYVPNYEARYTRKYSPYGSHQVILSLMHGPGLALDLGSARGLLTESLLEKKISSVGVDLESPIHVSAKFERYLQMDLENWSSLSFGRDFNFIVLSDVIEHLRNSQSLLRHVRSFLKKEGKIIVSTPNVAIWFYRLSLLLGRFNYGPKGILDYTHVRLYTLDSIRRELEEAGYVITRVKATSLPFEIVFESVGKSRLLKWIDKIYYGLVRIWPRLFAYQFVFEAQIAGLESQRGEGLA